ncbi:MAG: ABC transporter substrate-binding protein [Candidatus Methanoperedens sp.]
MNTNTKVFSIAAIAIVIVGAGLLIWEDIKPKEEIVTIRELDTTDPSQWELVTKLTGRNIPEEEGVKLEQITSIQSTGGTVALQALLANNIDAAGSSFTAWINVIASGGKIKALFVRKVETKDTVPDGGLLVLNDSGIYTIKDLVGKKIAVNVLGAESDYIIRAFLKQNGLSINDVQLVVVPSANQEQVLRSKQVDAAAWTSSGGIQFDMALEKGGVRSIPGTRSYDVRANFGVISYSSYAIGFSEDFIQKHPETVRRYVRAYLTALHIVAQEYQKDPERVKKAYAEVAEKKGGNPKLSRYYKPTGSIEYPFITDEDIQWWIDRYVEDGILKPGQIKPSDVYTNEFNPFIKTEQKKGVK